ncbi:MAG TPA: hypothetical protein VMI35_10055 [Puia sp.]|nr:hypothetical protein [Puia sp.]
MKKILLIQLLSISSLAIFGQTRGEGEFHGNWVFGFPIGNDFVTNFSALGANFGYSRFIKDGVSVGVDLGWNNYYQYAPTKTYVSADGATTTDLYKYLYTLPITAFVSQFFHGNDVFTPYVKLGLGAQYSEQNLYYNIYETTNDNWGFVFMPEVGTLIHFNKQKHFGLNLSARYTYGTNSAQYLGINNVQTVNFSVGFMYIK